MVVAEDHLEVAEEAEEDKQPVLTILILNKTNQLNMKNIFLALGLSINNARSQDTLMLCVTQELVQLDIELWWCFWYWATFLFKY
jgi:hypothetical protein